MTTVTVSEGLRRAARLIPFRSVGSSRLTGDYGAVCSPWQTMPARFQESQRERTAFYMSHSFDEGSRSKPDHAVRYYVTSYGVPVAWVTLDGRTHYADDAAILNSGGTLPEYRAKLRHRDAIRAQWPDRFEMNSEGDPVGPYPLGVYGI